jgi:hypothetical protein
MFYLSVLLVSYPAFSGENETVWITGDTIYYSGGLSKELNEKLFKLYAENSEQVKWVAITSKGGEMNTGLDLGSFIFNNKLSVKVDSYCMSSCANYVFTAGVKKVLSEHALIGYHGGASSTMFDTTQMDELPEPEKTEAKKQWQVYLSKTALYERTFFDKIGVQQKITTLGQEDKYQPLYGEDYVGWSYSIEDFEKLGVRNILLDGPVWKPKQFFDKKKVLRNKVDDI